MELIKTTPYAYNWKVTAMTRLWGWEEEMGMRRGLFRHTTVGNNISHTALLPAATLITKLIMYKCD